MSYEIIPFKPNAVPDYIRGDGPSELTKSLLKKSYSVKRISIRGKVFRLIVGGEEVAKNKQGYLDVVIVNGAPEYNRTYYDGQYDPRSEEHAAPRCWSYDSKVPAPDVEEPMHDNCRDCPMNVKGSGNGDSRACRIKQRIAVMLAVDPESGVYMLEIPAASIFGKGQDNQLPWEAFVRFISSQNISVDRLVTRIVMDEDSETPRLLFTPIGYPSKAMVPLIDDAAKSEDAKLAVQMNVYQADTGAAPKGLPAPAKKAALPAPVEEEEEEEAPPPPPKKKAKPVVVEEEEEEEAPPPKKKAAPAGFASSDDEDDTPPPAVRAAKPKPEAPKGKPDVTSILSKFVKKTVVDDEDE
jgi:hypothetical protein